MPLASRPFLIGVAGGTCAGKTVVCERLAGEGGRGAAGTDPSRLLPGGSHAPIDRRTGRHQLRPSRRLRLDTPQRSPRSTGRRRVGAGADIRLRRAQSQRHRPADRPCAGDRRRGNPRAARRRAARALRPEGVRRRRRRPSIHPPSSARCRGARSHARQHHRAIPHDRASGPRAVHRAEQAVRRRDRARRWRERTRDRTAACPRARDRPASPTPRRVRTSSPHAVDDGV